ncbi:hypothetical protein C8241_15480, partial [Paracidovorax avenae]
MTASLELLTALRRRGAPALWAAGAALLSAGAQAQAPVDWRHDAVPFYDTTHALQGLYTHWGLPRATEFAQASGALPPALRALCSAAPDGS